MRTASSLAALLLTMTAAAGCLEPTTATSKASAHWSQCMPCHGHNGEGDPGQLAPGIAGLPAWYVDSQLLNFRNGVRGTHFDDVGGLRMRPMALSLHNNDDVKNMADYVAQLPTPPSPATITGDAAAGKNTFATCAACHGPDGGGNEALNAPPIAGRNDWYIYDQLKKFRAGARGAHPKDAIGPGMRAIALTLPDDKALHDVARYVATLPAAVSHIKPITYDKALPKDIDAAMKAVATESQPR